MENRPWTGKTWLKGVPCFQRRAPLSRFEPDPVGVRTDPICPWVRLEFQPRPMVVYSPPRRLVPELPQLLSPYALGSFDERDPLIRPPTDFSARLPGASRSQRRVRVFVPRYGDRTSLSRASSRSSSPLPHRAFPRVSCRPGPQSPPV